MRHTKTAISLTIIITLIVTKIAWCAEKPTAKPISEIAIDAVHRDFEWTRPLQLFAKPGHLHFLTSGSLYEVRITEETEPSPVFYVVINDVGDPHVFFDYHYMSACSVLFDFKNNTAEHVLLENMIQSFSKIAQKEGRDLSDKDITYQFVNAFLYLVGSRSDLLSNLDEIYLLKGHRIEELIKFEKIIKPIRKDIQGDKYILNFFSWKTYPSSGVITKWSLAVTPTGEILAYERETILSGRSIR